MRIKTRVKILSLSLVLVMISASLYIGQALQAPTRTSTGAGGSMTSPCSYDNFPDTGKFVAKNCQTGIISFVESSAYALWVDENASGLARFWEPGTWDFTAGGGAGAVINNLSGVTDWGVYGQTIFKCSVPACIALNIGNQNAVDQVYHSFNYTIHDLTLDGAGQSNSACMGVATALNTYINHVIMQNCFELATGCFRATNWNTQQLLNKGLYIENTQFIKCKITLSGTINGYLRSSAFIGLATGAAGTKALVDFSKGDIVPTAVNNLGNFCFCGNTISGWTLQIFLGFQAISNDTIAENTVRDANTFVSTTDTAGGIYFEGLTVRNNYYSSSTGPAFNIGYGHSIILANNIISFDTNPGAASSAITIEKSLDPTVNQNPKNVQIMNNEIYKWGGIGMDLGFTDGLVVANQIYNVNQAGGNPNSDAGINTGSNLANVVFTGNSIISDVAAGAGLSRPIIYNGGKNLTITGNVLQYYLCATNGCAITFGATADPTVAITNNLGENPIGKLANFIVSTDIGICGTGTTVSNNVAYSVCGTPIMWTCTGGTVTGIAVKDQGGNQVFSVANCAALPTTDVYTPLGYTITFTESVAPTVTVFAT